MARRLHETGRLNRTPPQQLNFTSGLGPPFPQNNAEGAHLIRWGNSIFFRRSRNVQPCQHCFGGAGGEGAEVVKLVVEEGGGYCSSKIRPLGVPNYYTPLAPRAQVFLSSSEERPSSSPVARVGAGSRGCRAHVRTARRAINDAEYWPPKLTKSAAWHWVSQKLFCPGLSACFVPPCSLRRPWHLHR